MHGGAGKFQSDPHWRDLILFYEYFHGDNGAGLGASHQTGWTGLVAPLARLFSVRGVPRPCWPRASARRSRVDSGPSLPGALSDQHPGVAPRAGRGAGPPGHARRRSRRRARPDRRRRLRLGLAPRRLADGRGRAAGLAAPPEWQPEYRELLPDFTADDVCGSPFAVREYVVHRDFGGPGGARPACASGWPAATSSSCWTSSPTTRRSTIRGPASIPSSTSRAARTTSRASPHNYHRIEHAPGAARAGPRARPVLSRAGPTRSSSTTGTGVPGRRCWTCSRPSPSSATACAATWPCWCCPTSSPARGATGRDRPTAPPVDDPFWPEAIAACAGAARTSSSWPRRTGTWSGRSSSRASTTRTTSGSTTACAPRRPAPCGATCRPHPEYQRRSARFLENHDEPRAAAVFPPGVHQAAAVLTFLVPGPALPARGAALRPAPAGLQPSAAAGRRSRLTGKLEAFYNRLLACMRRPEVREGEWRLLEAQPAWERQSHVGPLRGVLAGRRRPPAARHRQLRPTRGQCYVRVPDAISGEAGWS